MTTEASAAPAPAAPAEPATPAPATDSWNDEDDEDDNDSWEPKKKAEPKPKADAPKESEEPPKRKVPKMVRVGDEDLDEDTVKSLIEKGKGADRKFREAAEKEKNVHNFIRALQQDPIKALNNPHIPLSKEHKKELAETWLRAQIEEDLADPRDVALKEQETVIEKYKRQEREAEEAEEKQRYSQKIEQRKGELSETLAKAMEKSPLSKNDETAASTLREMALYLRACKQRGEDPSPEEIAQHVEMKRMKEYYGLVHNLEGEDLVGFLGEAIVNKLRKYDLARLKSKRQPAQHSRGDDWQSPSKPAQSGRIDPWEARERARSLLGK